ncbi:MAG TPA: hypothetical protein VHK69_06855 [Chitinophagaceae bacterium]|nr:hypothetical protein [Chitinophagaceae bacterium]
MNDKSMAMQQKPLFGDLIGWLFGSTVLAIGVVNTFWGNDPGFGLFLVLLSFVYYPPAHARLRQWTGFSIPVVIKFLLAVFIIWAALGVGELFAKVDLMMADL